MKIPYKWLKDYINTDLPPKEVAQTLTLIGNALDKPITEQAGDTIMDFEDRGNRADVMGIVGIARDLAAVTGQKLQMPATTSIPEVNNEAFEPKISVNSPNVTRWTAVIFKNINITDSPDWLKQKLESYGIEPKNNMVDITNYVMIETGMPMHAFDMDKVDQIILRQAVAGEKLVTFEGTELEFDENDLVAADSTKPLTLTTAIGGQESGITSSTKNVLLEAGLYNQPNARRSAQRLNVRNETSQRLGKYLHPDYCPWAIERAIYLIKEILNADPTPIAYDYYPKPYDKQNITLTQNRLNLIAGEHIDLDLAQSILKALEFSILETTNDSLSVQPPFFRTDVNMEDAVIEEVLRIRGYNNINAYLPEKAAPTTLEFPLMEAENKLKDISILAGATEVIGQQIIDEELLKSMNVLKNDELHDSLTNGAYQIIKLQNSWNKELNILRPELLTSLLKYYVTYTKHGLENIKLFETGKIYLKDKSLNDFDQYVEKRAAGYIVTGDFYDIKITIESVLQELGIIDATYKHKDIKIYTKNRCAEIKLNGQVIGHLGELKASILNTHNIKHTVSFAQLDISKLPINTTEVKIENVRIDIQNYITEDITLIIDESEEIGTIISKLKQDYEKTTIIILKDVYVDENLQNKCQKSITLNFKYLNNESASSEANKIAQLRSN